MAERRTRTKSDDDTGDGTNGVVASSVAGTTTAGSDGGSVGEEADPISFTDALDELNSIVAQLEAEEVDVDVMTQNVERAAQLIGLCRDRLDSTRYKVEEIIVELDPQVRSTPREEPQSEPPAD